ncbi:MAG: Nicotinate-nucleotide--dimethylbenzimidazole phosphoribosyltransferase [Nitrosopumilales archaeon]|nr:MAG: Nicotinate-nucleotide--dimethylbenzimidazole phosphoribosyltransferase [Nitrosopumilales archaeon]
MQDIEVLGCVQQGIDFIKKIKKKNFLFSLVISYTETCEIPGITVAGANLDFVKFTPAADAEFLHYGNCKCIDVIPMTPDGKPTPAILTKVALEAASIPTIIINAGSKVLPNLPYLETGIKPGKNIALEAGLDRDSVTRAVEYGRIIGRFLGSSTDCLVIGESIPGGTTTALGVLKGFDVNAKVSSSMLSNPVKLKNKIVDSALKRFDTDDPFTVLANVGDPMIPTVSGMLSSASESTNVLLAGGTQMAAILAFSKKIGFKEKNTAIGTTSYIIEDKTANFVEMIKQICDVPILVAKLKLAESEISGLRSYAEGFVKEGVGAGGASIASMLKIGLDSSTLLSLTEKEYQRITLQSQT